MTFDVEDAEKVFRFDGQYPFRRAIETLTHYRQKLRPDIYGEYGSLLSEWVLWLPDLELESIQIFSNMQTRRAMAQDEIFGESSDDETYDSQALRSSSGWSF